jgi:hypothetical protein
LAIVLSVLDLRLLITPLVRVAQFLVSVYCLLIIVCPFVLILLAIVLSVLDLRLLITPLVRVAQFLVSVYCLLIIVCPFVLILLAAIVLSVFDLRLRMTWHIQTFFSSDKLFPVAYHNDLKK